MPRKSLRCLVTLNLHAITCPGVWLPRREDVFLAVSMFGQYRRTQLIGPAFPLLFHEKFKFDKVFYTAIDPTQVVDSLDDYLVLIELVQMSTIYGEGRVLAEFECSARDFLFPYPSYSSLYSSQDREVLMNRTIDFPGIAPRLEFSTKTSIKEIRTSIADTLALDALSSSEEEIALNNLASGSMRRSRSRQRRRTDYGKPTLSSVYRSRSVSPGLNYRLDDLSLSDPVIDDDIRPPFVVRRVDKNLIHRVPGSGYKKSKKVKSPLSQYLRARSVSPSRSRRVNTGSYTDDDYYYTSRRSQVVREPSYEYTRRPKYSLDSSLVDYNYGDIRPLSQSYISPARSYNSPSYYRSTTPPYLSSTYDYGRASNYYRARSALDDIDLELQLARSRRYYP